MISSETLEFPAGLLDIEGENMIETAKRELLEDTGYSAESFEVVIGGEKGLPVSPGLTNERLSLVIARGASKIAEPSLNEGTKPILIPLSKAYEWLIEQSKKEEVEFKAILIAAFLDKSEGGDKNENGYKQHSGHGSLQIDDATSGTEIISKNLCEISVHKQGSD